MVQRIGGMRRNTRYKLQKNIRQKGKISLTRYFQPLTVGQRVILAAESAVHAGMYHPRFHNKVGTITEKKGNCYIIQIKDNNKSKLQIVHPVHLKRVE